MSRNSASLFHFKKIQLWHRRKLLCTRNFFLSSKTRFFSSFSTSERLSETSLSNLRQKLEIQLRTIIQYTFPSIKNAGLYFKFEKSSKDQIDYSSPIILQLSHLLKKTPEEIFETLAPNIPQTNSIQVQSSSLNTKENFNCIAKVSLDNGFLNFQLNSNAWIDSIQKILNYENKEALIFPLETSHSKMFERKKILPFDLKPEYKKNVLVDFSSPNMCKELHIGHLRSTILGDAVSTILKFMGHDVEKVSHVGDFGTPIGLVLAQIFDTFLASNPQSTENDFKWNFELYNNPSHLSKLYVEAKKRGDDNPEFYKKALFYASSLQNLNHAPPYIQEAYRNLCEISRKGFQEIYQRLNIKVTEKGESFYSSKIPQVIEDLKEKNLTKLSHGALCIFLKGFPDPLIIQKSDGAFLYSTTDLAALKYRIIEQKKNWIIYVTDRGQSLHFRQIFQIGELMNWKTPDIRLTHLYFGIIKGADGKRLSSREGNSLSLVELLDQSLKETNTVLEQHFRGDLDLKQETIKAIAYSAIKYYDLRHSSDYKFSFPHMLSLKGNTAVYLLYAYTRLKSIQRKTKYDSISTFLKSVQHQPFVLSEPCEFSLAICIAQFPEVIVDIEHTLNLHLLCDYLFDLAGKIHYFYETCHVIGDRENDRLRLCIAAEKVLHQGMMLLGCITVEKM